MGTLNGIGFDDTDKVCADCKRHHDPETSVYVGPHFLPGDWNERVTLLCGPCSRKPKNQTVSGTVCHAHFDRLDDDRLSMADIEACADCQRAIRDRATQIQRSHTIDPDQPYGEHIALYCVNHPDLRWHTKNIDCIGARSIFYAGNPFDGSECPCPGRDLRVVPR